MAQLPDSILQRHKQQDETIKLDKEGNWYHGEYPILHDRTVSYFHKNIARDNSGQYYLTGEDKPIYFEVEDVPFFVKKIEKTIVGFLIYLTDESIELLDLNSMGVGEDNALYCLIKGGEYVAKFYRSAYMELSKFILQEGRDYIIQFGSKRYPIKPGKPAVVVEFEAKPEVRRLARPPKKAAKPAAAKAAKKTNVKPAAKKAAAKKAPAKKVKPKSVKKAPAAKKAKPAKKKVVKKAKPAKKSVAKKAKPAKKKKK